MPTIPEIIATLNKMEENFDSLNSKQDLDKFVQQLEVINHWQNSILPDLAFIGNKIISLQAKIRNKQEEVTHAQTVHP
jgi:hypothetical protein